MNAIAENIKKEDISRNAIMVPLRDLLTSNEFVKNYFIDKDCLDYNKFITRNSFREVNPDVFYNHLLMATSINHRKDFITIYTKEEYRAMRTFILNEGIGGYAITKSGEIASVFKNPTLAKAYKYDSISSLLILNAIENGGDNLSCFNGYLSKLYVSFGFIPIYKMKFNKAQAPTGWDYDLFGEPDVIYFAHNGDSPSEIIQNRRMYKRFEEYDIPYIDSKV